MSGNEFRFFLSCDINLPVTFKIERLEGKLPACNPPDSGIAKKKNKIVVFFKLILVKGLLLYFVVDVGFEVFPVSVKIFGDCRLSY